jgi:hypothetical protein
VPMRMRTGQLWECENAACGCEVLVVAESEAKSRLAPRCSCGGLMKKSIAEPEFNAAVYRSEEHRIKSSERTMGTPMRTLVTK